MPQLAICDGLEILIARATSRKQRSLKTSVADWLKQLLLFGGWFLGTETCVGTGSKFVLELFDTTGGVDEL